MLFGLAFTVASTPAAPTAIGEPGFEADGTWKFGQTGAVVDGFFGKAHADCINAGLIDSLPDRGSFFTYNNGPQHDLYQVLAAPSRRIRPTRSALLPSTQRWPIRFRVASCG
jgi:hypothetical protein